MLGSGTAVKIEKRVGDQSKTVCCKLVVRCKGSKRDKIGGNTLILMHVQRGGL